MTLSDDDAKNLHQMVVHKQEYDRLNAVGLVSVNSGNVMMAADAFSVLAHLATFRVTCRRFEDDEEVYPVEFSFTFEGTPFIALFRWQDVRDYNMRDFLVTDPDLIGGFDWWREAHGGEDGKT